jgi:hypothetical protein
MVAAFREVKDLTEGEPTLPLCDRDGCISQELEMPSQPPLGKITVPDSQVAELGKSLARAINFTDYFQWQTGGDCGLTSVNNLVGFEALTESFLHEVQKHLRKTQPDRAHHYVCN